MKQSRHNSKLTEWVYEAICECSLNAKISGKVYMLFILLETLLMAYYAAGGQEGYLSDLGGWDVKTVVYIWTAIPLLTILAAYRARKGDGIAASLLVFGLVILNTFLGQIFISLLSYASVKQFEEQQWSSLACGVTGYLVVLTMTLLSIKVMDGVGSDSKHPWNGVINASLVKLLYKVVLPLLAMFTSKFVIILAAFMINILAMVVRMSQIHTQMSIYLTIMDTLLVTVSSVGLFQDANVIWALLVWFSLALSLIQAHQKSALTLLDTPVKDLSTDSVMRQVETMLAHNWERAKILLRIEASKEKDSMALCLVHAELLVQEGNYVYALVRLVEGEYLKQAGFTSKIKLYRMRKIILAKLKHSLWEKLELQKKVDAFQDKLSECLNAYSHFWSQVGGHDVQELS